MGIFIFTAIFVFLFYTLLEKGIRHGMKKTISTRQKNEDFEIISTSLVQKINIKDTECYVEIPEVLKMKDMGDDLKAYYSKNGYFAVTACVVSPDIYKDNENTFDVIAKYIINNLNEDQNYQHQSDTHTLVINGFPACITTLESDESDDEKVTIAVYECNGTYCFVYVNTGLDVRFNRFVMNIINSFNVNL